jgi:hypothetical protein
MDTKIFMGRRVLVVTALAVPGGPHALTPRRVKRALITRSTTGKKLTQRRGVEYNVTAKIFYKGFPSVILKERGSHFEARHLRKATEGSPRMRDSVRRSKSHWYFCAAWTNAVNLVNVQGGYSVLFRVNAALTPTLSQKSGEWDGPIKVDTINVQRIVQIQVG